MHAIVANHISALRHSRSGSAGHAAAASALHALPSHAVTGALWSQLRGRRLGVQFRRQVVIGSYIVDFLAPAAGLVLEVDVDDYHARRFSADRCRDAKLHRAGYAVLRLPASLVTSRLDDAVSLVAAALAGR